MSLAGPAGKTPPSSAPAPAKRRRVESPAKRRRVANSPTARQPSNTSNVANSPNARQPSNTSKNLPKHLGQFSFQYLHPITEKQLWTSINIPGPAWDTVLKKVVQVVDTCPSGESYFILNNGLKRSQDHIRGVTATDVAKQRPDQERAAINPSQHKWLPCTYPALTPRVLSRLQNAMLASCSEIKNINKDQIPMYQLFVERVAKGYAHFHSKKTGKSAGMHADREKICRKAVEAAMETIPPRSGRPHKGRVTAAIKSVLPALETMFDMPDAPSSPPEEGSPEWIDASAQDGEVIPYTDAAKYPALMRALVKWTTDNLCDGKTGLLILRPGEEAPTKPFKFPIVKPSTVIKEARRAMHPHANAFGLRAGGFTFAGNRCRNDGFYPRKMLRASLPEHVRAKTAGWNNYTKFRNTFHAYYCASQNFSRTSDEAREALVYIHHGLARLYDNKNKKWTTPTVIAIIHKRMQTGHHRFTKRPLVKHHWKQLFDLLEKKPHYVHYLDDKNSIDAPEDYLVAVELGLRSWGRDPKAFGKFAMLSKSEWNSVPAWRKRECYIAAARCFLGSKGYLKYISFRWADYLSRKAMSITFNARHLPYSNGTAQLGLSDDSSWDDTIDHRKRKPFARKSKQPAVASACSPESSGAADHNGYDWDSDNDEWILKK